MNVLRAYDVLGDLADWRFHVAPAASRDRMLTAGLTDRPGVARRWQIDGQPDGIYLWTNLASAVRWARAFAARGPRDLWAVHAVAAAAATQDPCYFEALVLPAPAHVPAGHLVPLTAYTAAGLNAQVAEDDLGALRATPVALAA